MSSGGVDEPSTGLTDLPPEIEDELFAVWMDESREAAQAGLLELCAKHPSHASELRRVAARLDVAQEAFPVQDAREEPAAPERIGAYRVVRQLGRGGFAVVWLAEQERPLRRQVAIKVLSAASRAGGDRVLRRFDAERQTLAQLQHTGIANVYDAGQTEQGDPYIVMEFVPGVPITRFCDERQYSIEQRLEIFVQVCAAVQHAHQNGILHRDLKPGNILVHEEDGPRAKVIDFGLAKALEDRISDEHGVTEEGRFVGTPEYMSPEQACATPVDTRTDIYSLGVLLYELLTGELPIDSKSLRGANWNSALRVLREEEPLRPSEALRRRSTDLAGVAAKRRLGEQVLLRRLRGDLSWIVMCAIEKDRERRYASALDLGADVRRYLRKQPLSVAAPSLRYRLGKLARRHRAAFAATSVALVMLVLLAVGAVHAVAEIVAARNDAVERKDEADANLYAAQIALAKAAFDARRARPMLEALQRAPESYRNWEWRHLASIHDGSLAVLREADDRCYHVTVDPQGQNLYFARRSRWSGVEAWDLSTGEQRFEIWRPVDEIFDLAISPDGRTLAIGYSRPAELHLHDAKNGSSVLWEREGASRPASLLLRHTHANAAFHPKGAFFVAASGPELRFFRTADGEEIPQSEPCRIEGYSVQDLCFDPAGRRLLAACNPGGFLLLEQVGDSMQFRQRHFEASPNKHYWSDVDVDGAGRYAAFTCPEEQRIHVFALDDLDERFSLQTGSNVYDLCFLSDSGLLLSAQVEGSLCYWDLETRHRVGTSSGHTLPITSVDSVPGLSGAFSASRDGTIRRWAASPQPQGCETLVVGKGEATALALHPSEDVRFESNASGVYAVRLADESVLWHDAKIGRLSALCVSAARGLLFAGSYDGRVYCWDAKSGKRLRGTGRLTGSGLGSLEVSRSGQVLAALGRSEVVLLDPADLSVRIRIETQSEFPASNLCFLSTPTGAERLLLAQESLQVFDARTGERLADRRLESPATGLCASADGRLLAVSEFDARLRLLDAGTLEPVQELHPPNGTSRFCYPSFHPDGSRLVIGDNQTLAVRMFDTERGVELLALYGHRAWVAGLGFDTRGESLYLLAGPGAGTDRVRRWRAPLGIELPPR